MLLRLILANANFAINVFGALVFFATGWLHLDSWQVNKKKKTYLVRSVGFFLLSLVFLFKATSLSLPSLILSSQIIKILGLSFILFSLIREPILTPPIKAMVALPLLLAHSSVPLAAVLFFVIALIVLRKTTEGYEKQIRPLFWSFLALATTEALEVSFLASETTKIVTLSELLMPYGLAFNASLVVELIGLIILGVWTWGYLRFRSGPQLFILFITSSLFIFVVTASSFTYLLFRNFQITTLDQIKKNVSVLNYALDEIKSKSLTNAKAISENAQIKGALANNETETLYQLATDYMFSQNTSLLDITDVSGKVVTRAEDKETVGDSLSENLAIKNALSGKSTTTVAIRQSLTTPLVEIQAASPIYDEKGKLIGTILTGYRIDNAFVDGVKSITGLDISVFGGSLRAATTFLAPDGKSRLVGTKETNPVVLETVLDRKETFAGPVQVLNQPFYTAYAPLLDANNNAVGMLFVGSLQTELIKTLEASIQTTFAVSVVLMLASLIPAYFISKYVEENQTA